MDAPVGCFVSPSDFDVNRFIGRGCYSVVYEVAKRNGTDSGSHYALKRFFLENDSSVKCVLRERRILERLALADYESPFLPKLLYGLWFNYSSAFILREGAGCDLYDLLCHVGFLSETNARFYLAEVICGLEHLHSLNIVHLDIKPENVLFYPDGHVFLSDLDRSFDISLGMKPTLDDFTGTPLFMAPEIAKGEVIDLRADIWSLGALVAEMVAGPIRPDSQDTAQEFQRARSGTYAIRGLKRFSKPLQSFFTACLQKSLNQRPHLKDVKKLRFLRYIDWEKANNLDLLPPYKTSEIHHRPAKEERGPLRSTDQRVLSGAFSPLRPVVFASSKAKKKQTKQCAIPVDSFTEQRPSSALTDCLRKDGYTLELLDEKFKCFNFVHPSLRCDCNATKPKSPITKLAALPQDDLDTLFGDKLKIMDLEEPSSPSLFRRTRKRGLSIGD
ncbi:hypothetical protein CRM22_008587 [Opisthorchis felineus]|uniref:Protein kinase domain-containing protein n=1 Tax=Opisthorchis felineus TaxID=147828 RepID=A0A4S2LIS2_OPIFE|nr:hypothetical protein CRM22_008587 [Opisthorchis felineus]